LTQPDFYIGTSESTDVHITNYLARLRSKYVNS